MTDNKSAVPDSQLVDGDEEWADVEPHECGSGRSQTVQVVAPPPAHLTRYYPSLGVHVYCPPRDAK